MGLAGVEGSGGGLMQTTVIEQQQNIFLKKNYPIQNVISAEVKKI